MKKNLFLILLIILCFCFSGCGTTNNNANNSEIIYSTNWGLKIENLSGTKQSEISDYVEDCKVLFIDTYKEQTEGLILESFIDFTDVFVYDFRGVDESALDKDSLLLWKEIKKLHNNETNPLMYIEINGYCPYYSDDSPITQINQISIMNGFFIYNDNTVVCCRYQVIMSIVYIYGLVSGTTIINCGNKYAESIDSNCIKNFDAKLEILKIVE